MHVQILIIAERSNGPSMSLVKLWAFARIHLVKIRKRQSYKIKSQQNSNSLTRKKEKESLYIVKYQYKWIFIRQKRDITIFSFGKR